MAFSPAELAECKRVLEWGLREDLGEAGDITSQATIPETLSGRANLVARQSGFIAGLELLQVLMQIRPLGVTIEITRPDGPVEKGATLARYAGNLRGILAIERVGLNLLGRLSGIATMTAKYVARIAGTKAVICDTRKTMPGLRYLEKLAVRVGGGTNHRVGLFDAVLIKDNHLAGLAQTSRNPVVDAIVSARKTVGPGTIVECEIDSLHQLEPALAAGPDIVLLDNMSCEKLQQAVGIRNAKAPQIQLEASGGVTLETVAEIARTGVDRISVGAITHSAGNFDVALDFE